MIRSFRHKGLRRFYDHGDRRGLSPGLIDRIEEILALLDVATTVQDMALPQFRLHALKGERKGQWAVTVRANWRIVFRFDGAPDDVDLVDYH